MLMKMPAMACRPLGRPIGTSMKFSFTEEQTEFRGVLRRFLEAKSPATEVRKQMATDAGFDPAFWRALSQDIGLTALHIPEEYGGAGFGVTELAIACEEMGRALACAPFFASGVMAASAIVHAGTAEQKAALLPGIARGETIATLAAAEPGRGWDPADVTLAAAEAGSVWRLSGVKSYVLDGMSAGLAVVSARLPNGHLGLFAVQDLTDGVARAPLQSMDPTRKLARLEFRETPAMLLGSETGGEAAYARTIDTCLVCLANEMAGGAERLREDALEYVSMRVQFGRSIASFQVTKHKAADMLLDVELAKSAAYSAATAMDDGDKEASAYASMAKAAASDAYIQAAIHAVQMHGGIGFTFDNDTQLWFKRAKASEAFLGDAAFHRERMLQHWTA
jgi:alkylation response protein AidB-like acyl-CoA dehydrogenase